METDHTNVILFLIYLALFLASVAIFGYSTWKRWQIDKLPPDQQERARRQDFDEHRP